MDERANMIRTAEGKCWLNTVDADGRRRSSYLGDVGSACAVQAWCAEHGVLFYQSDGRVKSGLSGLRTNSNKHPSALAVRGAFVASRAEPAL